MGLRDIRGGYLGIMLAGWCACGVVSPVAAASCDLPDPANKPVPIAETQVNPPYPPISKRLGEQGVTVVRVEIGADGAVLDDFVRRSSGSERLDAAAAKFVKENWRWRPPVSNCRPAAAVTDVLISWDLLRPHDGTADNTRPLPPLPATFDSWPSDRQKTTLSQYLVQEVRKIQSPQQALDLTMASMEKAFKARLAALPEPQQRMATAAFENALDEAFQARVSKTNAALTRSFADHLDLESLKALVAFYATPLGRKSLATPGDLTQEDRRAVGEFFLSNPKALEFSVATIQVAVEKIRTKQQDDVTFVQDFQKRFCSKLAAVNLRDSVCTRPVPATILKADLTGAGRYDRSDLRKANASARADSGPSPAPSDPPVTAPGQDQPGQAGGCTAAERQVAQLARQNGYHYAGVCE